MSSRLPGQAAPKPKVMFLITEDWFALSHFKPVVKALVDAGFDVVIATNVTAGGSAIEALGARVVAFDFERSSRDPFGQARLTHALRKLILAERPAVLHAIALKPIILGGLAFLASFAASGTKLVMHLTGTGYSGTTNGPGRFVHSGALRLIAMLLKRSDTALLVENPDDAAQVLGGEAHAQPNVTILGGAGVDPDAFPAMLLPQLEPTSAGFIGRMIWTKGVDVLVAAHQLLLADQVALALRLGGTPDGANPRSLATQQLADWGRSPGVTWLGRVDDVAGFWRDTTISVVPSRGGEGLPRSLLEAASCGRPLVVSDVPGCRHFVRHEVEGLIVPPDDAPALASALKRLVDDPALATALGKRARQRVFNDFSEMQVAQSVVTAYRRLLAPVP